MGLHLLIDPASATPIYAQVVDQVRTLVATGTLRQGDRLPSVRDLAVELRVNRNTAAKAYRMLETDGVLETRAGHGTFVANGGTRWSRAERRRRVEKLLSRAVVEASHLSVSATDVRSLLEHQLRALLEQRKDSRS